MTLTRKILLSIAAVVLLGNASGLVTFLSVDGWYDQLVRPPGTPPDGTFGPVWLLIYTLLGLAVALVWHQPAEVRIKRRALRLFTLQFTLNLLWTPAFFGLQRIDLALAVILPLLLTIVLNIRAFLPIHRTAAWLLLPYLLWVGYATYLNIGFLLLNGNP